MIDHLMRQAPIVLQDVVVFRANGFGDLLRCGLIYIVSIVSLTCS